MITVITRKYPWGHSELLDMEWDDFEWYYDKAVEMLEEEERAIKRMRK